MSTDTPLWGKKELNGLTHAIPYLLAGLESAVDGFELLSVALQRSDNGAFRCVLRGYRVGGTTDGLRLVAFSNGELASECILSAESGFRESKIRWHLDQFAQGVNSNGPAKTERLKLKP